MEISPEKCAEFVSQQAAWDIEGINMAVAVLMDDSTMESTSYSVAGYEDTAKLDQITKQVKNKDLQGCDKIGMTVQGQNAEVGVKILDASSEADLTYATSNTTKLNGTDVPGGGSYQMQGLVGKQRSLGIHDRNRRGVRSRRAQEAHRRAQQGRRRGQGDSQVARLETP
ncbi:hypothetical protein [Glutamicibacter protophormiae]|uniref:Uncharacterized protein n=1 Tax=Glutamicibacter protophormiae TaxID=37930 RepID=A0ABS4XR63_GLUPR|nr:hypothetical protein [Glutamicibacter protophormiae]MBP2398962.1 hypothetical protein [Glutamicibacter protophormiae]GGL83801.1 hypothetical protein GCM10010038_12300 [Glutamicibacter protophormiae]